MRAALIFLLLSGCASTGTLPLVTAGATFCQTAQPLSWSANDTRRTKELIDEHNAKGKAICGWGKK